MPHIRLEYSDNLPALGNFEALFAEIHRVMNEQGGIALNNCKSRVVSTQHSYIGDGNSRHAFVDLQVEFLSGRSQEIKNTLGEACLAVLKSHYAEHLSEQLQVTVGIHDIPRETYFKYPGGTLNY